MGATKPASAAASHRVIVVSERGTERTQQRLVDELEMMGFSVVTRVGNEQAARREREDPKADAVVFLGSRTASLVWVREDGSDDPRTIDGTGESPEHLALRTAEHLRGHLLPAEAPSPRSSRPDARTGSPLRLSVVGGPAVVYSRDAWAAVAGSADVSLWFGKLGVGPFILADLQPSKWVLSPKEFEVRQFSAGAGVRIPFLLRPEFRVEALGRLGWRRVTAHSTKGKDEDQFRASSGAVLFGGGVQATYLPRPWYGIGGQLVGHMGVRAKQPKVPDELPKKQEEATDAWVARKSADGLFQSAVVVMFFF